MILILLELLVTWVRLKLELTGYYNSGVTILADAQRDKLDTLQTAILPVWKKFLLNQFHDVIPGSCIEQVVTDALEIYSGTLFVY